MTDSPTFNDAKRWVDSLDDKWRLQILSKRFRIDKITGARTELPTRVRRFVEGCPWALVDDAIRYLISLAPYKGVIYNGVPLEGEYNPTLTTWSRDYQDEIVSPTAAKRNDGTYTLIQDLIEAGDVHDVYSAPSSVNCSEEVLTEWTWDAGSIAPLPTSTEQGVSYAITAVSRNEDGTFNYALVKRTSKPRFGGWSVRKKDAFETVSVMHADNLRGAPNEWEGLDIPESGDGVLVEVDYQQNEDCTYRVTVTKTETRPGVVVAEADRKDQFREQSSVERSGQAEPLGPAPEPADGVVVKHSDRLQPDGTYRTEVDLDVERPVSESTVEVHKGRRGTRQTVVDTNQDAPAELNPGIGGTVKVEKTPGKKFTNTVTTWIRSALDKVATVCKLDIFRHHHAKTTAGLSELPTGDVPSASGGVVITRRAEIDDEGSITETDETDVELPVREATVKYTVGLRGVRKLVSHRNVSPSDAPSKPSYSVSNIGTVVTVEKTPGDLRDVTVEEVDRDGTALKTGSSCEKTVFEHSHTDVNSSPNMGAIDGHVADAGGGTYRRRTVDVDDSGAAVTRDTEVKEVKVDDSDVEYRRTAKAIIKRTTTRNTTDVAAEPKNIGEAQSHTTNPGGTHNLTKTTLELTDKPDRAHCEKTVFEHVHDTVTTAIGDSPDTGDVDDAGSGSTYRKDSVVDENGIITTTVRKTDEQPVSAAEMSKRRTRRGVVTVTVDRNSSDASLDVSAESPVGTEQSYRMNPGGSFDVTRKSKEASANPDYGMQDKTVFRTVTESSTFDEDGGRGVGDVSTSQTNGRTTKDVDDDGFIKTVERKIEEHQVDDGAIGESNLRFTSTTTSTRNSPSAAQVQKADVGHIYSWTSRRTDGGNYDTTATKKDATPFRSFSLSSSSNYHVWRQVSFFNATAADVKQVADECVKSFETELKEKNLFVSGVGIHCGANLTEFGLFDGYVSATCTYNPGQTKSGQIGSYSLTSTNIDIQPVWDYEIMRLRGIITTKTKMDVTSKFGYGLGDLSQAGFQASGGDIISSRADYTPSTNIWNLSYTRLVERTIEYSPADEEGSVNGAEFLPQSAPSGS